MDKKYIEKQKNDYVEINLLELFFYLKKKAFMIVLVTVLFGAAAGLGTHFLIKNKYASSAKVFVEPRITDSTYTASDLNANNYMIQNYVVMLEGNNIQTKVANNLNVKVEEISNALTVGVIDDTQIIEITATTTDPALSKQMVDETVEVFMEEMQTSFNITNISITDKAVKAKDPVSPSLKKNVAIGAALGLLLICGIYFLKFMLDAHIKTKEEAEKYFGLPNFGSVPYLNK